MPIPDQSLEPILRTFQARSLHSSRNEFELARNVLRTGRTVRPPAASEPEAKKFKRSRTCGILFIQQFVFVPEATAILGQARFYLLEGQKCRNNDALAFLNPEATTCSLNTFYAPSSETCIFFSFIVSDKGSNWYKKDALLNMVGHPEQCHFPLLLLYFFVNGSGGRGRGKIIELSK